MKQVYGFHNTFKKTTWYSGASDPKVGPHHNVFSVQDRQMHAAMRKRQAGFYAMSSIKNYEPSVDECVTALVKQFDALCEPSLTFDLQVWLQCYAFDAIGQMTVCPIIHRNSPTTVLTKLVRTPAWLR